MPDLLPRAGGTWESARLLQIGTTRQISKTHIRTVGPYMKQIGISSVNVLLIKLQRRNGKLHFIAGFDLELLISSLIILNAETLHATRNTH